MADTNSQLLYYATAEAQRVLKPKTKMLDAAQAAARRAPGIMLAAEVLSAMEKAHSTTHPLIPEPVKELIASTTTAPSNDKDLIERVEKWLTASPHELKRCKTAMSALAVVAPVVKFSTQLRTTPLDAVLVDSCLSALKANKRKADVSSSAMRRGSRISVSTKRPALASSKRPFRRTKPRLAGY